MAKRRAKLEIARSDHATPGDQLGAVAWCRLKARNGEIQLSGEVVANPTRSRAAIVRSMIEVLEAEGYFVCKSDDIDHCCPCSRCRTAAAGWSRDR